MNEEEKKAYKGKLEADKKKRQEACEHKRTKKEYYGGMDTGDKICLDCGKTI